MGILNITSPGLKRLGFHSRPILSLRCISPRRSFHLARTLLSCNIRDPFGKSAREVDLDSYISTDDIWEQLVLSRSGLTDSAMKQYMSKIETYIDQGNIPLALEELDTLLRWHKEARFPHESLQKLVVSFLKAEGSDCAKQVAALQGFTDRKFFYEQFKSQLGWDIFMSEVLRVSVDSKLFTLLQGVDLRFKNVICAASKSLDPFQLEETALAILNQVPDQHKQLAFNVTICSLGVDSSLPFYSHLPIRLLNIMQDKLKPTSEAFSSVIESQLKFHSKRGSNVDVEAETAVKLYRYSKKYVPNLSQRTCVELMMAINVRLGADPKYNEDLADIALDIIARESVLPFRTATFLLQALVAIVNESSNPCLSLGSPILSNKFSPADILKLWRKVLAKKSDAPEKYLEILLHCYIRSASNFGQVFATVKMMLHDYKLNCPNNMISYFGLLETTKSSDNLLQAICNKQRDPDIELANFLLRFETATGNNHGALVWFKRIISVLVPNADSWCIGINASLRADKLADTKSFIESALSSNFDAPLTEKHYLVILSGLRAFVSDKHQSFAGFTRDLPEWAIAKTHCVLDHMDRTSYVGAKDQVYTAALKNLATYISFPQCVDPVKAYRDFMLAFDQRISLLMIVPDASLFSFIFNAIGKSHGTRPTGTLADMEELYNYMIDSGVPLKPHTFVSLFHALASFVNQQVPHAYFSKLIELRASKKITNLTGWDQAFKAFFAKNLVSIASLPSMLKDMRTFGVSPDPELLLIILTRYTQNRARLEDLKQVIAVIREKLTTSSFNSDQEMTHKLLVKVCTALYRVGGAAEASKVVADLIQATAPDSLPPSFYWRIINLAFRDSDIEVGLDWLERLANLPSASASECKSVLELLHQLPSATLEGLTPDQNQRLAKLGFENPHLTK